MNQNDRPILVIDNKRSSSLFIQIGITLFVVFLIYLSQSIFFPLFSFTGTSFQLILAGIEMISIGWIIWLVFNALCVSKFYANSLTIFLFGTWPVEIEYDQIKSIKSSFHSVRLIASKASYLIPIWVDKDKVLEFLKSRID